MSDALSTARLQVRPPVEADRARFVELFLDTDFMVFYPERYTRAQANARFDHMVALCQEIPFGKQPVVERASGRIVGYAGVDRIEVDGRTWLEWGYRLAADCRGRGYATEANQALLAKAKLTHDGELLAIIAPDNLPSQKVIGKLGFAFWKQDLVLGDLCNLYTLTV